MASMKQRAKADKMIPKSAIWDDADEKEEQMVPPGSFWDELLSLDEQEGQWITPVLHS